VSAEVLSPLRAPRGMAVAPCALAAQSALAVLRDGGNAVEAMVAAAATIAVAYPHMNGIGGDGFWLIAAPGAAPIGIEACGGAAAAASTEFYRAQGLSAIPFRGPLAANTIAGTVSGWELALDWSRQTLGGRLPLKRLLADAIAYAADGFPITRSQEQNTASKADELANVPGFAETYFDVDAQPPKAGALFKQKRLAQTLERLAHAGLNDFYRGDLARSIAADLQALGSPLNLDDLNGYHARTREPLELKHSLGTIYNMPPPTQGLVSEIIVGLLDRLLRADMDPLGPDYVHACVEATKLAFGVRDRHITDPDYMDVDPQSFLASDKLDAMAAKVSMSKASPWPRGADPADTVWLGVIDGNGVAVSFIQSVYHEFGSGIVLPNSGINWQNRGCSFSLDPNARNALAPGRRPFHTLNPPLARFTDGRTMVYGAMGGDGQPQSQSAVFSRIVKFGFDAQSAVSAPRWLLGRTWGLPSDTLKLEARFPDATFAGLRALGHDVESMEAYDEAMGHAGAIIRYPDGTFEGGFDPRGDGAAAGW
jgi:gamma-glutamyltranspeptidase